MPTLPTEPTSSVDVTYSLPGGTTHNCTNSAQFTTALTNAVLGDVIVLTAGTTYTGPFTLPNKGAGTNWIYIISSALASLPADGFRVSPSDATNMPKVVVTSAASTHPVATVNGSHHFRFVGIEFRPTQTSGDLTESLLQIGNYESSSANLPHHIIFDRCYIHSNGSDIRRGVLLNCDNGAVINCHVSNFHAEGADTQAVACWNSRGPILVQNNYLEATGENMMVGGVEPAIPAHIPADITVKYNHMFKPTTWMAGANPYTIKNLFELKLGIRVLVEGNVFENIGWDAQNGFAVQLTPRNEYGGTPEATVEDVTFRYNKFLDVGSGFNLAGEDGNESSQTQTRVLIEHNIFFMHDWPQGDLLRVFQMTNPGSANGPDHVTIRHNTACASDNNPANFIFMAFYGVDADNWDVRDNITDCDGNNVVGGGGGSSNSTALNADITNETYTNNAMIGASSGDFSGHAGNFFPANQAAINFVNYLTNGTGDYSITPSTTYAAGGASDASDGTDMGAHWLTMEPLLDAAVAGTPVDDVTAPTLSSAHDGTPTSDGTVAAGVTTDEGNGTLYWAVVTNGGSCTDAELKAGTGGNIVAGKAGNQSISSTGAKTISTITGLTAETTYQIKFLHRDAAGNDSSQASASLTTLAEEEEPAGTALHEAGWYPTQGQSTKRRISKW